jgi:hypothetical protein
MLLDIVNVVYYDLLLVYLNLNHDLQFILRKVKEAEWSGNAVRPIWTYLTICEIGWSVNSGRPFWCLKGYLEQSLDIIGR